MESLRLQGMDVSQYKPVRIIDTPEKKAFFFVILHMYPSAPPPFFFKLGRLTTLQHDYSFGIIAYLLSLHNNIFLSIQKRCQNHWRLYIIMLHIHTAARFYRAGKVHVMHMNFIVNTGYLFSLVRPIYVGKQRNQEITAQK